MKKLIVATSNPGKLAEMQDYLSDIPCKLALKPPEIEIEETGTTFRENARLKAAQTAQALGEWAIADDSGLAVEALKGAPGIYSARYGQTDAARIERLLQELADVENRQAQFICAIAISNPQGEIILQTEGICPGEILTQPQGKGGFGYDPIFYVPEMKATFAEMPAAVKGTISHRGRAFAQLLPNLKALLEKMESSNND
ncbi:MAG: RdgB/HAM1 family non-canonical purine NTP pyrophosphatase [Cyanobacteria bacterium J083]|nr:MAG: RdgB/HAM1 family non-canonical purine NTP pyrophosphatase [Cyanobacteria bacterium J083]